MRLMYDDALGRDTRHTASIWGDCDRFCHAAIISPPMQVVISLIAIILALTFFPLGMVPFGVVAPAAIILVLGLGITARDGVFILLGLSLSFGVFIGTASLIFQSLPVF